MASTFIEALRGQFAIDKFLRFEEKPGGMVQCNVCTPKCDAAFYLQGAHVTSFHPRHQKQPLLFLSQETYCEKGKPIRGGIPLCFPWFSNHPGNPEFAAHGCVRTAEWTVVSSAFEDGRLSVTLEWQDDCFRLQNTIHFDDSLELSLEIWNRSDQKVSYEIALHTYFQISDIDQIRLKGLESIEYVDQLTQEMNSPSNQWIEFQAETDRIYQGRPNRILLEDDGFARHILVAPFHSNSTIIWNPWIAKSKRMVDFGDSEYRQMVCIETANVRANQRTLTPGMREVIGVTISAGYIQ